MTQSIEGGGLLSGRTAVVTGGAKGIGAAIVAALTARGAKVFVIDRDRVPASVPCAGSAAADIGDYDAVTAALGRADAELGPIELLVNNAGWDRVQPFLENEPGLWDVLLRINMLGVINVTHAALKRMQPRASGRIVNIASDAGRVGSSGETVYAACKGGTIAFTKSIAREVARFGILANCVCPGPTATPLLAEMRSEEDVDRLMESIVRATPLRKLATPEDVAAAVLYFAEEPGHVTGQVLSVSGGLTMAG
ncbi:SDR family NAD(P)-dependent oxidoreductase [Sphingomonas sp.]|jgi:2-hydroxycyclohexanecarboxyl-CoA dehydrogenase|uniref:SDR family NAD(P)-dependent oxidoreductase n=1 Tax=Sphingomonas sp. TaxID=28214 RepID=UPI002DBAA699|nr:SDR family NAD(P)-dependent oxidoreductase [Sphingomonas sp.]HEU4969548.1 SDR family NAD(P)-dependent oxidoreductase [Sphingomonas sp.]